MTVSYKGKLVLYVSWNSVVFISPISGNGIAGGYWWFMKAFIKNFSCFLCRKKR